MSTGDEEVRVDTNIRAAVCYYSRTGNTRRVAEHIHRALEDGEVGSALLEIKPELELDYLDYELVFLGAPVYGFLPPEPVSAFLRDTQRRANRVVPGAPERPGHAAVVFCTYGGGHTGVREAVPTLKYMGQFLEHQGVRVVDEWAVVGENRDADDAYNRAGRIGSIAGRPNDHDLQEIYQRTRGLLLRLSSWFA
jgi:flavorubredoxin